jgi:hypothetical protein
MGLEKPRDLLGVVDVHLTSEGLDEVATFVFVGQKIGLRT